MRSTAHPPASPAAVDSTDAVIVAPCDAMGAQVFRGSWISLLGQSMQLLLRLGSTVVLARLLTPEAYGLVAMVAVLTGFISLFKSLGLATATIQAPRLTHAELNGLFWINAGLGCAAMIVTIALGPVMAWFYDEPRITSLTLGLSVTFLLAGLAVQPAALLRRRLRFGTSVAIEVGSVAAGAAAAIALAASGAGPWALVGGVIATEAMNLTLVWAVAGWKPTRPAFGAKVGNLVALGRDLTQFNILNYWARNLDNFLIGWYWGAAALGTYGRAYQLLLLPLQHVTTPLAPVAFAAPTRLHDDEGRLSRGLRSNTEKVAIACMPLTTFFFFSARQVVELLLGPRWLNVAPIFTSLAAAGLVQPVSATLILAAREPGTADRATPLELRRARTVVCGDCCEVFPRRHRRGDGVCRLRGARPRPVADVDGRAAGCGADFGCAARHRSGCGCVGGGVRRM